MNKRKLATVRTIREVTPVKGADKICLYKVDGWQVIDQVGKYRAGDRVIYCETDSWIPNEIAPFLTKGKEPREYKGVKGEKLRSIRLRGELSQGLLIPCLYSTGSNGHTGDVSASDDGADVTDLLGIQLWEREIPVQLRGVMKGNFPSFIRKTDQERIQNLTKEYNSFQSCSMEVTEKLEGSSLTTYFFDGEFGVCSRNIDLKETEGNTFWKAVNNYHLRDNLTSLGLNIAIQGELIGSGIQGNIYDIPDFDFFVYDVFDIDLSCYYSAEDRLSLVTTLGLKHAPVLGHDWHATSTIEELLIKANGNSLLNPKQSREGIVLKALDGSFSFKVISNNYLLKELD